MIEPLGHPQLYNDAHAKLGMLFFKMSLALNIFEIFFVDLTKLFQLAIKSRDHSNGSMQDCGS